MAKHIFDSWEEANEAVGFFGESRDWFKEKIAVAEGLKKKAWKVTAVFWGPFGVLLGLSVIFMALLGIFPESDILTGILSLITIILFLTIPVSLIYGIIRLYKEVIAPLGGWSELKIFRQGDNRSSFANKAAVKSAYWAGRLLGDAGTGRVLGFIGLIWKPLWSVQKIWFRLIFPPFLISGYIGRRKKQILECDKYIRIARKEMTLYKQAC